MPDIKTLEIFRSIADLGSFQAAARNMGLSLSAISLQMKRLEEFAQLKLFDRSKKPPRLTRDGLVYLDKIDAVLDQWQELEPANMSHQHQKQLTIGTVHSVLSSFLPLALKTFRQKMPDLDIIVRLDESFELEAELQAGTIDAAIISRPGKSMADIIYHSLKEENLVLITGPNVVGDNVKEIFRDNPYVRFNRSARVSLKIDKWFEKMGLTVESGMEIDTLEGVIALVHAELGVSIVPMVSSRLFPSDMRIIPLKDSSKREVVLAVPRINRNNTIIHGLLECCKKAIDDETQ
ncbi:MAG: LysR family transcriptional regulator [Candidatus Puniceispirillales bacterium]